MKTSLGETGFHWSVVTTNEKVFLKKPSNSFFGGRREASNFFSFWLAINLGKCFLINVGIKITVYLMMQGAQSQSSFASKYTSSAGRSIAKNCWHKFFQLPSKKRLRFSLKSTNELLNYHIIKNLFKENLASFVKNLTPLTY